MYNDSCVEFRAIGYPLFTELWDKLTPHIAIATPRTGVCNDCQKNNEFVLRTINVEVSKKMELLKSHEKHLYYAEMKRIRYKNNAGR